MYQQHNLKNKQKKKNRDLKAVQLKYSAEYKNFLLSTAQKVHFIVSVYDRQRKPLF